MHSQKIWVACLYGWRPCSIHQRNSESVQKEQISEKIEIFDLSQNICYLEKKLKNFESSLPSNLEIKSQLSSNEKDDYGTDDNDDMMMGEW